ncbi:MAG: 1,4-alpha-glucan branching protein GlgB [Oscillospiraceae bacterium]|nr:1,4-alpha-glucan branching protein GlgB [Oscillospiraceae bacterium]
MPTKKRNDTDALLERFAQGSEVHLQDFLGCHPTKDGRVFRVWAPHAQAVHIMGDFNGWATDQCPMENIGSGVWEGFVPGLQTYDTYKYAIHTAAGEVLAKADPFAFHAETRPANGSKVYDLEGYQWGDKKWLDWRKKNPVYSAPLNIYEMHLGSWRRTGEDEFLSYRDMAKYLVPYIKEMGFTHVELMPITEHPLDMSWGYQCTGYFAATSRFGTPHDFMYLVDELHKAGIGVILDWVPSHFPRDGFGLYHFDGEPCFEYADPRKGEHKEWGTMVFDFGRNEVRSFLISSALFWLEQFHIDGLRVDAVASMLYLDYNRQGGEWIPNIHGGHENLEAVSFLQALNTAVFANHPDVLMIAEESTAWPLVTAPVSEGGLGFNLKWNMGWMNDIQHYIKLDPYFRQYNHKDITFSLMYAFSENFILPLSHDEVVHMKGSLLNKIPGEYSEKFAGVRAFYTYMLTHPGKKLLMMGSEFGQWNEWHYEHSLDWHLLEENRENRDIKAFFQAANNLYLQRSELWEVDFNWEGFQWLEADDHNANTVAFLRKNKKGDFLVIVCNFSPVHREGYRVGVPVGGKYEALLNSDDAAFGGAGLGNKTPVSTESVPCHNQEQSMIIDLPPMASMIFRCTRKNPPRKPKAAPKKAPGKTVQPNKKLSPAKEKAGSKAAPAKKAGPSKTAKGKKET